MPNLIIRVPQQEAIEKIENQIKRGKEIVEIGIKILKEAKGRNHRIEDTYEDKFNMWRDITSGILRDIFENTNYSSEFYERRSSKIEYVGSDWTPDIEYWIERQLVPKIDYLETLKDGIKDFQYSSKSIKKEDTIVNKNNENKSSLVEKIRNIVEKNLLIYIFLGIVFIFGIVWGIFDTFYLPYKERDYLEKIKALQDKPEILTIKEGEASTSLGGCFISIIKCNSDTLTIQITIDRSEPKLFTGLAVGKRIFLNGANGNYSINIQKKWEKEVEVGVRFQPN